MSALPLVNSRWNCRGEEEKQRHLSVWSRTVRVKDILHIMMTYVPLRHAIIYWSWHYYLSLHQRGSEEWDLRESCLPAQKKQRNSRWYSSDISSQSTITMYCFALMHTKGWGSFTNLSDREDRWYLRSTVFIIQHNGRHYIYRCSDLCWASK